MIIVTEEINSGTSGARNPSLGGSGGPSAGGSEEATVAAAAVTRGTSEEDLTVEFSIGSNSSNGDDDDSEGLRLESPG